MKVKELIRQLKEFDPEARVFADSYEGKGVDEILCSPPPAGCRADGAPAEDRPAAGRPPGTASPAGAAGHRPGRASGLIDRLPE